MNNQTSDVNSQETIAPLQNVALCKVALSHAVGRAAHLPGLVALYGKSGWGKTFAATYAANKFRACYVEAKEAWTKKAFLKAVLKELGVRPANVICDMVDQIAEELALSGRPLIIDEMDHLVKRNLVELVRDIYESSKAPILMIGEENLENNLRKWERFHNRVLEWVPAQPSNLEDVRHLAMLYAPEITITDDLLEYLRAKCDGVTRRICINIETIRRETLNHGLDTMDRATWGNKPLFTGKAPSRI